MPLADLERELRSRIRERIELGELPSEVPSLMWGGNGTGDLCTVCEKPIGPQEVEFEYLLPEGGASISPSLPWTLADRMRARRGYSEECDRAFPRLIVDRLFTPLYGVRSIP